MLVAQSYLTLCDPMDYGAPLWVDPVYYQAPLSMEFFRQEY